MCSDDIQTLNQKAREGEYELTAISYHAYPYVADKYVLMAAGSSIGDGYGPMVVASHPMALGRAEGQAHRDSRQAHHRLPDAAPDAAGFRSRWIRPSIKFWTQCTDGKADAGLVIHEAQLTYCQGGFHNVVDLGRWWKNTYDLPLAAGRECRCGAI